MSYSVTVILERLLSHHMFLLASPKSRTAGTECNSVLLKQFQLSMQVSEIQALISISLRATGFNPRKVTSSKDTFRSVSGMGGRMVYFALFQKSF